MEEKLDFGYNPQRDLCAVSQEGVIELKTAFAQGSIPNDVPLSDAEYDNNENPRSIIGKPSNVFDAMHLSQTLKDAKASADSSKESTESQ